MRTRSGTRACQAATPAMMRRTSSDAWPRRRRDPAGRRSWAIDRVDDGKAQFAGTIELRRGESTDTATLAFGLHPAARGAGVMSRAVRLAAARAFETGPWGDPLTRLHWRAVVGNWGSRRVAWATGFTFHGTLPGSHVDPSDPQGTSARDAWHASVASGDDLTPRLPWFEPPVMDENGIRLRPWRDDDIHAVEERNDPEHWMPPRSVLGREMFAQWLLGRRELMSEARSVEWCVADAATDRALGGVTVFSRGGPMTGDVAELGYQLSPERARSWRRQDRGAPRDPARPHADRARRTWPAPPRRRDGGRQRGKQPGPRVQRVRRLRP